MDVTSATRKSIGKGTLIAPSHHWRILWMGRRKDKW